jgi:molybdopterin/thiamine biosynthesis adenylyltransferase
MTVSLVTADSVANDLHAAASLSVESAAVLLADVVRSDDMPTRIVGHRLIPVPDHLYRVRTPVALGLPSEAYVPALAEAAKLNCAALFVHTHPNGAAPRPSQADVIVDAELADVFRIRTEQSLYGSLIVGAGEFDLTFSGYVDEGRGPTDITRWWAVGDRWRLRLPFGAPQQPLDPAFDRNVRAFGDAVQRTVGQLRVAIVGTGGTGSAVAEQLARLGVRQFLLVDPDCLSASNLTRVYGSTPRDIGMPKVEVLREHLMAIAPDTTCDVVQSMITLHATARRLAEVDLVFGCTDDNAGRIVLSRVGSYLLTPVIDCGVLLSADSDGQLTGIDGRVTTLTPGAACLVCRNRIDLARAAQELRTPDERRRLADEGYAPALGRREPAVVTFTSLVASAAVAELIERLVGYGPSPRPSELLLRWHDRETSSNIALPRPGHYCDPTAGSLGRANTFPFLGQAWPDR